MSISGTPSREDFESASAVALNALRSARAYRMHLPFRDKFTRGMSIMDRRAKLHDSIAAAKTAVEPLAAWLRGVAVYRGTDAYMNRIWPSAHEAAVAAASEAVLFEQASALEEGQVYLTLQRDVEQELAATLAKHSTTGVIQSPKTADRFRFDEDSFSVSLDGQLIAKNVPADAFHYFRLLVSEYPNGLSWSRMKNKHTFNDSSSDRLKLKMPSELERLILRERSKAPKLQIPPRMLKVVASL